ncbi:MAG: acyl transferase [Bacteroidetes bacterium]|nr:acyl transferase [Bacteroidota bacterium]
MSFSETFKKKLFEVDNNSFEATATALFKYQAKNNKIYNKYISYLGIDKESINNIYEIPFLPINFFKTQKVVTGEPEIEKVFVSSGTTGQQRSTHYIADLQFYLKVCEASFRVFYGDVSQYIFLALLPSYLADSSLICMVDHFIGKSNSTGSGFIMDKKSNFFIKFAMGGHVERQRNSDSAGTRSLQGNKTILFGVTFALLDLVERQRNPDSVGAEKYGCDLPARLSQSRNKADGPDMIIMETGGMKGRRKELLREDLHNKLKNGFDVKYIHSEYGMTELMSQAYSKGCGKFMTPPWMSIILRDFNDPFNVNSKIKTGGINIIDLANVDSCAFIETQDLGRLNSDGSFEVLGRIDNADIRGCSLMYDV